MCSGHDRCQVGMSNRLLTRVTPLCEDSQGALSANLGVSTRGLCTHQDFVQLFSGIPDLMNNNVHQPLARDAEMTIKLIFERSGQKGGRQGGSKRGSTGDPP